MRRTPATRSGSWPAARRPRLFRTITGGATTSGRPAEVTWIAPRQGNGGTRGAVTPSQSPEATAEGAVIGTPAYMAPELADGRPASSASDIYALGTLLYVLLCGHLPYDGQSTKE